MKTRLHFSLLTSHLALGLVLLSTLHPQLSTHAQGTAFTYQGRLNDGAAPANGSYDLRFILYTADVGGSQVGPVLTNAATAASNGLFTVTLDFGANIFTNTDRFLEIAARTNGSGSFTTLSPRQKLTPAPYAIFAENVGIGGLTAGTYGNAVIFSNAANSFSGSFSGNGANVTNVNAATLGGQAAANFWQTSGNNISAGQFLGSANNQPLELKVNGQRALRLEAVPNDIANSNVVNIIGGSLGNFAASGIIGATIGGGGAVRYNGQPGRTNKVTDSFATVGGGQQNTGSGNSAVVGGGYNNTASGVGSTIGGGANNTAIDSYATVGGGFVNTSSGQQAVVGGGGENTASGSFATVPGGDTCTAAGDWSFAAGHRAKANHTGAFVWADSVIADFASSAADQFLIRAAGGVGIGLNNPAGQLHVASASGSPQVQVTQKTVSDYARLRMNVAGSPSWEMDVSPGATPAISWWTSSLKMNLDFNGNLTTSGTVNGTSDRNAKEKFTAVNSREMLDKVAVLPISEWNFKNESAIRHIGPMAQDFYAAFSVGMDDKHIATVDEGGVALAAIQGLNQKVEVRSQKSEDRIQKLETENAELKQRLEALEKIIRNPKSN